MQNGAHKNISIEKKKNRKIISLLKAPFKNATKNNPSAEDDKFACLKWNSKNSSNHNFSAAFAIAYAMKYYNESQAES